VFGSVIRVSDGYPSDIQKYLMDTQISRYSTNGYPDIYPDIWVSYPFISINLDIWIE